MHRHKKLKDENDKESAIAQLMMTIGKDVKNIRKIHVDVLGNMYQVDEKLVLQL